MRILRPGKVNILLKMVVLVIAAAAGMFLWRTMTTNQNIEQLLTENRHLKEAITNLNEETQIGYAKVLSQEKRDGKIYTKLLFVETDRQDPLKRVLEKEYEIEGDVVHFDALVVKFDNRVVMDGTERSMYLWRRVYGETMLPEDGYPIEEQGRVAQRYADICEKLSLQNKQLFWGEIWALSNNPQALAAVGVRAIYGNVVYHKLEPRLIYVFKISGTGNLYPEIVPDL
jgi:hypothetical protein